MKKNILVFDTSIASQNLGDLIIVDSVKNNLASLFPASRFFNTSTHEVIGRATYSLCSKSHHSFVAGTNLLSSKINQYNQWKVGYFDGLFLRNIILMGVGWWQYQPPPNFYTRLLYRRLLSHEYIHSVRDTYTLKKLNHAGFSNVVNTGCPTTWMLTHHHCASVPRYKSEAVVFTLTDYSKDVDADLHLIKTLKSRYHVVYFWPQGSGDLDYFKSFNLDAVVLAPSLDSYDEIFGRDESIDYVGTRLHAGIRALQFKRRSIILSVDNRASEMGADINLPVVSRTDFESLKNMIDKSWLTDIRVDFDAVDVWKDQFIDASPSPQLL